MGYFALLGQIVSLALTEPIKMLQEFLNKNLITINDDLNLDKLKKASDELLKRLSKSRPKLISFTLAALDPSVSIGNKDISEVKDIIIKSWPTFLSNVKDTPVTYVKAVIFHALQSLSSDINNSAVIYLTGVDTIEQFNLTKQKSIVKMFFESLGNNVELQASRVWSLPNESKPERVTLDTAGLAAEGFDKAELDKVLKTIKNSVNKLIAETNVDVEQRRVLQLRSQLLWWKEASYSPSIKLGYSTMNKSLLPFIMAYDYSRLLPLIYPLSADHFFKNALSAILQKENKLMPIGELLKHLKSNTLKHIFEGYQAEQEKISLGNFALGLASEIYNLSDLGTLTGIDESMEILPTDYGLWLLHNLQANKVNLIK